VADPTCQAVEALEAEVALGIAAPEEVATVLAHVEHCASCRGRFRSLGEVTDCLVELVPTAEPPSGFESRVLSAFREGRPVKSVRRDDRKLLQAAAVILVVVLVGVGGWLLGSATAGPGPGATASRTMSAELTGRQGVVGLAIVDTGPEPWVSMAVQGALGQRTVRCQVQTTDHRVVTVGTFTVTDGYGYWAAPLPAGSTVRSAQLVSAAGRVLATARFNQPG
jgi:predicted anti-sigma-YlaC factor YlaD